MLKKPAGYLVGSAQASNAPWSAMTWTTRAVILPSLVAASSPCHLVVAGEGRGDRFSIRSSTHFTGTPVTIEATTEQI